jgi:hypothetical protein
MGGRAVTEEEWLACDEPGVMLTFLEKSRARDRGLRLFAAACACRALPALTDARFAAAVAALERLADEGPGKAASAGLRAAWGALGPAVEALAGDPGLYPAARAVQTTTEPTLAWWRARWAADWWLEAAGRAGPAARGREAALLARLLRDAVGNPHRPAAFDPAWRSPTAVALAARMYESRDFGAMPLLADALQEAGCEDAEVLRHCRHGEHVRGCWVVDLVLGRT